MHTLNMPLSDEAIRSLKVGDPVALNGVMITGRDTVHKWMVDTFIKKTRQPQGDDLEVYAAIKPLLAGGVIYHCGPVGYQAVPVRGRRPDHQHPRRAIPGQRDAPFQYQGSDR
jgi:tartrate dehydratase beta subunit/fumarate hydratase class I family protein